MSSVFEDRFATVGHTRLINKRMLLPDQKAVTPGTEPVGSETANLADMDLGMELTHRHFGMAKEHPVALRHGKEQLDRYHKDEDKLVDEYRELFGKAKMGMATPQDILRVRQIKTALQKINQSRLQEAQGVAGALGSGAGSDQVSMADVVKHFTERDPAGEHHKRGARRRGELVPGERGDPWQADRYSPSQRPGEPMQAVKKPDLRSEKRSKEFFGYARRAKSPEEIQGLFDNLYQPGDPERAKMLERLQGMGFTQVKAPDLERKALSPIHQRRNEQYQQSKRGQGPMALPKIGKAEDDKSVFQVFEDDLEDTGKTYPKDQWREYGKDEFDEEKVIPTNDGHADQRERSESLYETVKKDPRLHVAFPSDVQDAPVHKAGSMMGHTPVPYNQGPISKGAIDEFEDNKKAALRTGAIGPKLDEHRDAQGSTEHHKQGHTPDGEPRPWSDDQANRLRALRAQGRHAEAGRLAETGRTSKPKSPEWDEQAENDEYDRQKRIRQRPHDMGDAPHEEAPGYGAERDESPWEADPRYGAERERGGQVARPEGGRPDRLGQGAIEEEYYVDDEGNIGPPKRHFPGKGQPSIKSLGIIKDDGKRSVWPGAPRVVE